MLRLPALPALPSGLLLLLLLLLLLPASACDKKAPAPGAGASADAAPASALAPDAAPPGKAQGRKPPELVPPSKEARKEYAKQLAAGRKHAKAGKWAEAAAAFEKALVAIPGDGRALSELSWAAFNAGDYARAKKAGGESVLGSTDKNVKASALYNLGRVEEALEHAEVAVRLYRESLELRDNKQVKERLAALEAKGAGGGAGAAGAAAADEEVCATPRPLGEICACLQKEASFWGEDQEVDPAEQACDLAATGVKGLHLATAKVGTGEEHVFLVAEDAAGASVAGRVETVYNPGAFGIYEELGAVKVTSERHGDHELVRVVSSKSRSDSDMGINEVETEETERLLLCVRGGADGKSRTICPVDVPTRHVYVRDILMEDEQENLDPDSKALQTKGLPIKNEIRIEVTVDAAAGVAHVVLKQGSADWLRKALGDKKLW